MQWWENMEDAILDGLDSLSSMRLHESQRDGHVFMINAEQSTGMKWGLLKVRVVDHYPELLKAFSVQVEFTHQPEKGLWEEKTPDRMRETFEVEFGRDDSSDKVVRMLKKHIEPMLRNRFDL